MTGRSPDNSLRFAFRQTEAELAFQLSALPARSRSRVAVALFVLRGALKALHGPECDEQANEAYVCAECLWEQTSDF